MQASDVLMPTIWREQRDSGRKPWRHVRSMARSGTLITFVASRHPVNKSWHRRSLSSSGNGAQNAREHSGCSRPSGFAAKTAIPLASEFR